MELADSFPLLATLVEQRAGGQQRLPTAKSAKSVNDITSSGWAVAGLALSVPSDDEPASLRTGVLETPPGHPSSSASHGMPEAPPDMAKDAAPASAQDAQDINLPAERGSKRPGRYGLSIQFESRPGDFELGRLVESTVWINEAHPAYLRAVASRSEGYHIAVACALALARLAVEPAKEHPFVTAFLESWGSATSRGKPSGANRRRHPR